MSRPALVPQEFPTEILILDQEFRNNLPQRANLLGQLLPIQWRVDLLNTVQFEV
jgi:hypothetical protein